MSRFYLFVWLEWLLRLTLSSVVFAGLVSAFITLVLYMAQGVQNLNSEVYMALLSLFKFWFAPLWGIGVLVALFRGTKDIFNRCKDGYKLVLYSCAKEENREMIEVVGLGDIVKVWRKLFMLIIWLVAAQMIVVVAFTKMFTSFENLFEWFDVYVLYGFIAIAGYFSLIILGSKCKQVKIIKC
ncbi:MAG: hypothetical protein U9N39_03300 [Campylobacterota bacterium]|nr:hypothetical protein [Campylobacterota bacterium]